MSLQLLDVSYRVGSQTWLYPMDLTLPAGVNVLLGATQAGKTTLLRLLAGLERPTTGRIVVNGQDVTDVAVRRRSVAMVYQQFINYPSLSVYENIASPLRLAGLAESAIAERVGTLAETLRLTPFLHRRPAELSGGQQQRTALARALAKDAELVLLDEPLVNLDYKLREELRAELAQLFAERRSIVLYATTEPQEALQLGAHAVVLGAGRVIQHGSSLQIFRRPATLAAARAFSDPPLNEIRAHLSAEGVALLPDGVRLPLPALKAAIVTEAAREVVLGIRAQQLARAAGERSVAIDGRVELAEISGSHTYLHMANDHFALIAQLPGVQQWPLGAACRLHVDPSEIYCFDAQGQLLYAPGSGDSPWRA